MAHPEPTNQAEQLALAELTNHQGANFCIVCGRPRRHKYCPIKGRGGIDHKVIERNKLSLEMQLYLYLLGPTRRGKR